MVLPAEIKAALLAALADEDLRTQVRGLLGIEEREKEIKHLKEIVEAQNAKIKEQDQRLSEIEQYSRKNVLNFTGIPEGKDENCLQLALDLGQGWKPLKISGGVQGPGGVNQIPEYRPQGTYP